MGNVENMFETAISNIIISFFGVGNKKTYKVSMRWLHTKNPHFHNTSPARFSNKGNHMAALDYVKKNMDPKVRARCLAYKSERYA